MSGRELDLNALLGEAYEQYKEEVKVNQEETAAVINGQLDELLDGVTLEGEEPVFGIEEVLPGDKDTYERAIKLARSRCPHQPAMQVELTKWFCPSCRRMLDINDLGIGGV